jgi:hypothetical protein
VATIATAERQVGVAALVNPYVIALAGVAVAVAALAEAPGELAPLVVPAAFLAGWSSAWSP